MNFVIFIPHRILFAWSSQEGRKRWSGKSHG